MLVLPHFVQWSVGQERRQNTELDEKVLAGFAATFISRRDMYPVQVENGTYITVQKTLTDTVVAAHLKGYITIGAYALDLNGWAKWLCFDADDEKHWKSLNRMAKCLESNSI